MGLIRRVVGVIVRPRVTMAVLARNPAWLDTWLLILAVFAACGGLLLSSDIGRQALVDERVRVIEAFGGSVDDTAYAALQANPPWWVYFTSAGRLLLTPEVTLVVAVACWIVARRSVPSVRFVAALAVAVHATVILALGQLISTPLHYLRESLTTPFNTAAVLPLMEEGTPQARFFGTLDLFALWWLTLLAVGLAALTGQPTRRYVKPLIALYLVFAAIMAGIIAAMGGQ